MLVLLVLKNVVECTSQRLKWTSGARVLNGRTDGRTDRRTGGGARPPGPPRSAASRIRTATARAARLPFVRLRVVLKLFLGRTEVITGPSKAKNRKEFEFYRRKSLATLKLDENERKQVSRLKNSDEKHFWTSENEMLGIV